MAPAKKKSRPGSRRPVRSASRHILYAPWRHTYIKKALKEDKDCAFCQALRLGQGFESLIVYKGPSCSVILNKYPYNNGHTMIIPNRHTADFGGLSPGEFEDIHKLLQRAYLALQKVYEPQGMNIGMNLGRTGGAGITDHLHYHLVPRWLGDTNFMPVVGQTKVISEDLEETYRKLVPLFV